MQDKNTKSQRKIALRNLLTRARGFELTEIHDGVQPAPAVDCDPGDEIDVARDQEQAATDARLLEHRWASRAAVDGAFERLRLGQYGLCEECGDEISLERLKVVPFASSCVDCQHERERKVTTRHRLVDFRQTLDLNEPILILRIRPQSKVSEECHRGVQTTS